jgi:hypothetical protein
MPFQIRMGLPDMAAFWEDYLSREKSAELIASRG